MESLSDKILNIIPPLDPARKKGENGRIAIIGGSYEFTGAPYYAAMGALKGGADMAHLFCPKCVATPIRAYSPEFVVHPTFTLSDELEEELPKEKREKMYQEWIQKIFAWENAITSWVIGPGLGRDKYMGQFFPILVKRFKPKTLIIFDADGVYFLAKNPELLDHLGTLRAILTPNKNQFQNLNKILNLTLPQTKQLEKSDKEKDQIICLSDYEYKRPFELLLKDRYDIYLNNTCCFACTGQGSGKRCGGIGDILAGLVGTFAFWDYVYGPILACLVCRSASKAAFEKQQRGLTAPAVLNEVHPGFVEIERRLKKYQKPNL